MTTPAMAIAMRRHFSDFFLLKLDWFRIDPEIMGHGASDLTNFALFLGWYCELTTFNGRLKPEAHWFPKDM